MSGSRLPRTLRLDASDTFVFAQAAKPGEWAVTGAFLFWDRDVSALAPKERIAFRSGFVGVRSLGFSTLVVVVEASEADREAAITDLALHLQSRFGAPDRAAALAAAREEIEVAASLCSPGIGSILAMHRVMRDGEIGETFRTLHRRDPALGGDRLHAHARAFRFVETDEEEPEDGADLAGLLRAGTSP